MSEFGFYLNFWKRHPSQFLEKICIRYFRKFQVSVSVLKLEIIFCYNKQQENIKISKYPLQKETWKCFILKEL